MKRCIVSLVMALAALCAVTIAASAAEADSGIAVQLNGQNLEFTDARPQILDNRTFLPYRAVFEAMGAEVGYDNNVVTAQRGDTALSMTIGETTATVTRAGVTEEITMDVAPYVDNATWRTYVPVRFAADAFGCSVGWDQAAQTVVILDADTLVDEALAGKEFTLLEQCVEYSEKYSVGSWAVDGALDASVSLFGSQNISVLSGSVDGVVSGNTSGAMSMTMDLDLASLMSYVPYLTGATLEDLGVTEEELCMSMAVDMKLDMAAGVIYMKMDDALNAGLGLPAGTWVSIDLNAVMAENDLEWSSDAMLTQTDSMDLAALLKALLTDLTLDDQAASTPALVDSVNRALAALSDEGFQKTADGYETALTLTVEDVEFSVTLDLTTTAAGEISGSDLALSMIVPLDETTKATLAASGLTSDQLALSISTSLDQNDQQTCVINLSMAPLFTADLAVEMTYSAAAQTPDTALPADAVVVDYMALMAGLADLQE